jgi:NitT/TauT family transport system ATP-binding protein
LWEQVRFTLLFVTHSIEEALVVGSRIGVLSPRPGRLRAEINAHALRRRWQPVAARTFQVHASQRHAHGLLFDAVKIA